MTLIKDDYIAKRTAMLIQMHSTVVLTISSFLTGFFFVWSYYVLTLIKSNDSPVGVLSSNETNLLQKVTISAIFLPSLFGALLTDISGRKKAKVFTALCFTIAWAIIATAKTREDFIIGYLLACVSAEMDFITVHTYISEISENYIRGTLLSVFSLQFCLGGFFAYVTAFFMSYAAINYLCLTICFIGLIMIFELRETPAFWLMNGDEVRALESLKFYRGTEEVTEEISNELSDIKQVLTVGVTENKHQKRPENENVENMKPKTHELSVWQIIDGSLPINRATYLLTQLLVSVSLYGTYVVQSYAFLFFNPISFPIQEDISTTFVVTAILVGSVFGVLYIDLLPRRALFLYCSSICTICLLTLGTIIKWKWSGVWVAPILVLVYSFSFQAGVINVILVQLGETFQPRVKCFVLCFTSCCVGVTNLTTFTFMKVIMEHIGIDGIFFLATFISYITTCYAYFFMKETRNTPIPEIMNMYTENYLYPRNKNHLEVNA